MLPLRNKATRGTERAEAVAALCEALDDADNADSSLLKHEIAFVLGQLEEGLLALDSHN